MVTSSVVILLQVVSILGYIDNVKYEGEQCGGFGSENVCKKVTECPEAIRFLRRREKHNLNRCSFDDMMEIVCCPPETGDGDSNSDENDHPFTRGQVRKSAQACDDLANDIPPSVKLQILGGDDAEPREFPHMAALGYRDFNTDAIVWKCGGSLISYSFVLTAAHCIVRVEGAPVKVRMGTININQTDNPEIQDVDIMNITVHPGYNRRTKDNDIALIKLVKRVQTTDSVHPACLYQTHDNPRDLIIIGWGQIKVNGPATNILQKAILSSVDNSRCNESYQSALPRNINPEQLCAVSPDGKIDTCQGDSGGPIQVQQKKSSNIYSIVGVTSFGRGCGGSTPGVYTRVSRYLDWIESIVWPT